MKQLLILQRGGDLKAVKKNQQLEQELESWLGVLTVHAALAKSLGSAPSTHIRWLTTAVNPVPEV